MVGFGKEFGRQSMLQKTRNVAFMRHLKEDACKKSL